MEIIGELKQRAIVRRVGALQISSLEIGHAGALPMLAPSMREANDACWLLVDSGSHSTVRKADSSQMDEIETVACPPGQ